MKREGRIHGMVRTYPISLGPGRIPNELSSPPTAGLFIKAPSKPTNHSKFTGKCGRPQCRGCHIHPACKSKEKAKGAHKTRSEWRVVDPDVLDYLDGDGYNNMDDWDYQV